LKVEILKSQKAIYQHMKKRALQFEDSNHVHIAQYRKNYLKASNRPFTNSSMNELNKQILQSKFVFIGDFHTFDHCLKNLLRVLKLLLQKNKKVVLALEMLSNQDFHLLQSFLQGHITELEFLQSINFGHSWKFPWTHYRSIFDFVKSETNIEVIGVNTAGNLEKRDIFCAEVLKNELHKNQDKTFVILYGEYHLAPNKIPSKIKKVIPPNLKCLVLHQNLDSPYWKILKHHKNITHQVVIKFNSNEFCLLSSPPWMKYESMCYWYENLYDDPEFDLHQYIIENGLKLLSTNTVDNFEFLCKQIISLFKLKIQDLSFNLYDYSKYDFLQKLINRTYKNQKTKKYVLSLLETQHMFIIPNTEKIYCASYSSNKLAKLAGGFLYLEFCKTSPYPISKIYENLNKLELFSHLFLFHFHAYFMAKAINPYLKCDLYLNHVEQKDKFKISHQIFVIFKKIDDVKKHISGLKPLEIFELSKSLGELCAESWFIMYQKKSKLFNVPEWKKSYLTLVPDIENVSKLLKETMKIDGFKNLKKRYY
jgi:hypothetical protein